MGGKTVIEIMNRFLSLTRHREKILKINQDSCNIIKELSIFAYKELNADHPSKAPIERD